MIYFCLTVPENLTNFLFAFAGSSNGRTPGSGPGSEGSTPSPAAKLTALNDWRFFDFR
jgi:hypothetical protein